MLIRRLDVLSGAKLRALHECEQGSVISHLESLKHTLNGMFTWIDPV